ncbi:hypothetical protein [Flavobacterium algicola]|uniref:hypothetical protein n=1 Tax=Flavobacterium algicola TaxID=556529 RepID=UPI001EFCA726|nr:hypothetical protein [Flavobacterium algicola]MCG9791303.1 hypothetical protein [Flavobacterium algicola]
MDTDKEITLRLRFYLDIPENSIQILQKFKDHSLQKSDDFAVKKSGNHIWLDIIESKRKYWSPHLHLEIESKSEKETHIRGLYGPDPTLWTFFMFLHFIIAGIFLVFCAIAYSDSVLKNPITIDIVIMGLMTLLWFILYYLAKSIRKKGHPQMNDLEKYFHTILKS